MAHATAPTPRTTNAVGTTFAPALTIEPRSRSTPCDLAPTQAAAPASGPETTIVDAATAIRFRNRAARLVGSTSKCTIRPVVSSSEIAPTWVAEMQATTAAIIRNATPRYSRSKVPRTPNFVSTSVIDAGTDPAATFATTP